MQYVCVNTEHDGDRRNEMEEIKMGWQLAQVVKLWDRSQVGRIDLRKMELNEACMELRSPYPTNHNSKLHKTRQGQVNS